MCGRQSDPHMRPAEAPPIAGKWRPRSHVARGIHQAASPAHNGPSLRRPEPSYARHGRLVVAWRLARWVCCCNRSPPRRQQRSWPLHAQLGGLAHSESARLVAGEGYGAHVRHTGSSTRAASLTCVTRSRQALLGAHRNGQPSRTQRVGASGRPPVPATVTRGGGSTPTTRLPLRRRPRCHQGRRALATTRLLSSTMCTHAHGKLGIQCTPMVSVARVLNLKANRCHGSGRVQGQHTPLRQRRSAQQRILNLCRKPGRVAGGQQVPSRSLRLAHVQAW